MTQLLTLKSCEDPWLKILSLLKLGIKTKLKLSINVIIKEIILEEPYSSQQHLLWQWAPFTAFG